MNNKYHISWPLVLRRLKEIDHPSNIVYGVPNGGMIASAFLNHAKVAYNIKDATIILDDLIDSGATMKHYRESYPEKEYYALFNKSADGLMDKWFVFPWEADHPKGVQSIEENIVRQLQYIGEDPNREGLLETPKRIVKSWDQIFKGYSQDPADCFKIFESDGYDEIVVLKNIELYSVCEHHMLPFYGKAHVAYIADKKVVGISKLARLLDIYARRLQIQERLCTQVTGALDLFLRPLGSACIIEAQHMCISGDSLVQLAYLDRSKYPKGKPIKDLVGCSNLFVYSFNKESKQICIDEIVNVWKVGKKKVYKVCYEWDVFNQYKKIKKIGSVKVTADHLFMLRNKPHNRYNSDKSKKRKDGEFLSIEQGLCVGDGLMPFNCYDSDIGYTTLELNNGIAIQEHRYLIEHKIGRKLMKNEVSHHKDNNSLNNSVDNIELMSKLEHDRLHHLGKKRPTELRAHNYKERNKIVCKNCGKEFFVRFAYMEKDRKFCSNSCYFESKKAYANHRIISIELVGKENVYDMETKLHHNFAINEVIVHNCMTMRGVSKQHSIMITSSLTGKFRSEVAVRNELMSLIKSN